MSNDKKVVLCILDGLGLNPDTKGNAVSAAHAPHLKTLLQNEPNSTLITSGERVGLPAGQMGNSEVGHLNIGAGRVVEQWLLRISRALDGPFLATSPEYQTLLKNTTGSLHLVGLYSDGGVHSHCNHLLLLIKKVQETFKGKIFLHLITDGRDTAPTQALEKVQSLAESLQDSNVSIASICGRFFAMDRDKRWERIEKSYNVIATGTPLVALTPEAWLAASYEKGITDEFVEPASFNYSGVKDGDSVIFWNFREDRMREIVYALCIDSFKEFPREKPLFPLHRALGFTDYDHSFHVPFLFPNLDVRNHLGEVVAKAGKAQLRVAETEKYAHVTYFFNGGIEPAYNKEERIVIPSVRDVKTYDEKPEMSARPVMEAVVNAINTNVHDLIVVNFANCDMVGHTGNLSAAIRAVETVDWCLGEIVATVRKNGWSAVVIADHGNAEQMVNYETGDPFTSHTTFPVPVIVISAQHLPVRDGGALCDVAPTVLKLMGIAQPAEMTGKSLI